MTTTEGWSTMEQESSEKLGNGTANAAPLTSASRSAAAYEHGQMGHAHGPRQVWANGALPKCDSSDCLLCSAWMAAQKQQHQQCSLLRKRSLNGTAGEPARPLALHAAVQAVAAQAEPWQMQAQQQHQQHQQQQTQVQPCHHHQQGRAPWTPRQDGGQLPPVAPRCHLHWRADHGGDGTTHGQRDVPGQRARGPEGGDEMEGLEAGDGGQPGVVHPADHDHQQSHQQPQQRRRSWATRRPPAWSFRPEFQALMGPAPARLHPYAQLVPLQGHHTTHDIISALEFSPNGQLLASGSLSKQVRLYSLSELFGSEDQRQQQCTCWRSHGSPGPGAQPSQQQHRHTPSWNSAAEGVGANGAGGVLGSTWNGQFGAGWQHRSGLSHGADVMRGDDGFGGRGELLASGDAEVDGSPAARHQPLPAPPAQAPSCPLHGPVVVHRLPSKVSCLSWSPAHDGVVCVGDYDGVLTQLHVCSGHQLADVDAHAGRRIWGVAHSVLQPGLCASVSEDGTAKLWAGAALETCVAVIRPRAHGCAGGPTGSSYGAGGGGLTGGAAALCGVDFSPLQPHLLAVAGADCSVLVYDLRGSHATPLVALHGAHQRPVSYVKFFGHGQLASASTDATLALWNLPGSSSSSMWDGGAAAAAAAAAAGGSPAMHVEWEAGQALQGAPHVPVQVFRGHRNEKNFVGLTVRPEDGLLACGSETDSVFVFHRSWSDPLASHQVTSLGALPSSSPLHSTWATPIVHSLQSSPSPGPPPVYPSASTTPTSQPFVSSVSWQAAGAARELGLPPLLAAGSSAGGVALLTLHHYDANDAEDEEQEEELGQC